jgi:hypothetical protein
MAINHDIQLLNNDLVIQNSDFLIAESDEQHIQDTINAFPGWWKQYPPDGVGLFAYMGGPANTQLLSQNIKLQLESDGYSVSIPEITIDPSGNMLINPNATP